MTTRSGRLAESWQRGLWNPQRPAVVRFGRRVTRWCVRIEISRYRDAGASTHCVLVLARLGGSPPRGWYESWHAHSVFSVQYAQCVLCVAVNKLQKTKKSYWNKINNKNIDWPRGNVRVNMPTWVSLYRLSYDETRRTRCSAQCKFNIIIIIIITVPISIIITHKHSSCTQYDNVMLFFYLVIFLLFLAFASPPPPDTRLFTDTNILDKIRTFVRLPRRI